MGKVTIKDGGMVGWWEAGFPGEKGSEEFLTEGRFENGRARPSGVTAAAAVFGWPRVSFCKDGWERTFSSFHQLRLRRPRLPVWLAWPRSAE
jgi:hypothetical protein